MATWMERAEQMVRDEWMPAAYGDEKTAAAARIVARFDWKTAMAAIASVQKAAQKPTPKTPTQAEAERFLDGLDTLPLDRAQARPYTKADRDWYRGQERKDFQADYE